MPGIRRGAVAVVLVAVLSVLTVAGCSRDTGPETGASLADTQQTTSGPVAGYSITIPKLGVSSPLVGLGLNPDHSIQVPALADPMQAGVYTKGPMPGQKGPAVVLAHVNAHGQPGFGDGFHTLGGGDEIDLTTPTGPVRYRVTRAETVSKSTFPTASVYSDTKGAELRLITCGGTLDRSAHNYLGQTIVWARRT